MRSRIGATATTGPNKGNGCATPANRGGNSVVTPLFSECFARLARDCIAVPIGAEAASAIQFRKLRRGNCW
jgi:hypothetical protein